MELLFGLGQVIVAVIDIWGVLHGAIIKGVALLFIGEVIVAASGSIQHKCISEAFIEETGLGKTNQSSTAITLCSRKIFTDE
jgi:uncharacterized membrane protein